jgi:hypothetical protein
MNVAGMENPTGFSLSLQDNKQRNISSEYNTLISALVREKKRKEKLK